MGGKFLLVFLVVGMIGAFVLGSTASAHAQHPDGPGITNIEGGLGLGTEPCCGLGTSFGLSIGVAFYHVQDIEIRTDISYFNWDKGKKEFRRIPFIFSGRYYPAMRDNNLKVYVQGGLGLSFDRRENNSCFKFVSCSDSETNLDLVPAAGVLFEVSPGFDIGGELAVHITDESYFTLMFKASMAVGN